MLDAGGEVGFELIDALLGVPAVVKPSTNFMLKFDV